MLLFLLMRGHWFALIMLAAASCTFSPYGRCSDILCTYEEPAPAGGSADDPTARSEGPPLASSSEDAGESSSAADLAESSSSDGSAPDAGVTDASMSDGSSSPDMVSSDLPKAQCGNGVVEPGEVCDGNCPEDVGDCDDDKRCTIDVFSGDDGKCTAMCTFVPITACRDDDGCCPAGCRRSNDDDC